MLELIIGPAGTGKTGSIVSRIKGLVENRTGGTMLIVPEQYSHEAERELCRFCGDTLSLYAEVFSFTGLSRRVMTQVGGAARSYLDKGGRMLCMALALGNISSQLKMYANASAKAELQSMLLAAVDELKTSCISSSMLFEAAEKAGGGLRDKLCDMALIMEAYDAVAANGHADPTDRLNILAAQIPQSNIGEGAHIYIDGFIDFTSQEMQVISALLKTGADLTVCLTLDDISSDDEVFSLSRESARLLLDRARELGIEYKITVQEPSKEQDPALRFFTDNLFSFKSRKYPQKVSNIELFSAQSITEECEMAAAKAIELVREGDCRWRDIAVAVRGFEEYRGALESVFSDYEVPLFVSKRSDILSKPIPSLISYAYEIIEGGWDTDDVIGFLRTGLTGLSLEECDMLENYIFKWQIKASSWTRGDWHQHPDGYGLEYTDEVEERLERINSLRHRIALPLSKFEKSSREAETASQQATALANFFSDLRLPESLEAKTEALKNSGREETAAEYAQMWDIIVSALEQCGSILGDTSMELHSFGKLFTLMLSKYDVGVIPVSLDRVSAGDFDRMRRRNIKHLIVLGAGDERLPMAGEESGIFSDEDRRCLRELNISLGAPGEGELWREFSLIYNCLTLPSEALTMSYTLWDAEGNEQRPSFVINRASALFDLPVRKPDMVRVRMSAPEPAMSLAANAFSGGNAQNIAAAEYFSEHEPLKYSAIRRAASIGRGKLSRRGVEALYGRKIKLSASRIDTFASCKFSYFCRYGLDAKPYEPAAFRPPEIGTFIHAILENTAKEVKGLGGFKCVDDEELKRITDKYVEEYIRTELNDFKEKSERFKYLFNRIVSDTWAIIQDMASELRRSDFQPERFELNFARDKDIPPVILGEGDGEMMLTGIADRIDVWEHEGKKYLRVVDYKTGKKEFSLSDVYYGMGLQMLLYLYALSSDKTGEEIVPAGVMYVPARNVLISETENIDDASLEKKRAEAVKRSGLVLDEAELIEAWEHGSEKLYIPIKTRYGKPTADSLAGAERIGLLFEHIKKTLSQMAKELRSGNISADPYYRAQKENACLNCDYFDACHFSDGENGEMCRFMPKLSPDTVWGMLEGGRENE